MAETTSKGSRTAENIHVKAKTFGFVKEGERPKERPKNCSVALLSMAQDQKMMVDLEG